MIPMNDARLALIPGAVHRFCTCWKLIRCDGVILRFTTHDTIVTIGVEDYTPVGGFDETATEYAKGLGETNKDLIGVLSAEAVTSSDLKAGKYDGGQVLEMTVDHTYPWVGPLRTQSYTIRRVRWTDSNWEVELEGFTRNLRNPVTGVFGRTCQWKFGSPECGVNIARHVSARLEVESVESRSKFTLVNDHTDNHSGYTYGKCHFISGSNARLSVEIAIHKAQSITLFHELPVAPAPGDYLFAVKGCDHTFETCRTIFSNQKRYGGFISIPGSDRVSKVPATR